MVASTVSSEAEEKEFSDQQVGSTQYTTQHARQMFEDGRSFSGNERFKLFLGRGDGSYDDMSALAGADSKMDGRALLATDFDDDGDVDLFVHNLQRERHLLFRNDLGQRAGGFVKVRLRATSGQWEAIGAIVTVTTPKGSVAQVLSRGAGFSSCQAPELVFGLGDAKQATIEVLWPGGAREEFGQVAAGARVLLEEASGALASFAAKSYALPDPVPDGLALRKGERVPVLKLVDAAGEAVTLDLAEWSQGKPVYLNFWASHCVPCVKELPDLVEIDAEGERKVLLISVDTDSSQDKARALITKRAPALTNLYLRPGGKGLEDVVDLIRLPIPTTLVLDAAGVVTEIVRGPLQAPD